MSTVIKGSGNIMKEVFDESSEALRVNMVDGETGESVDVVTDGSGTRRLAVDANFYAQNVQVNANLDSNEDEVAVEDPDTGAHIRIETDGSINVNIKANATDGDNIGLKVQERNASPSDLQYSKRVTATTGTTDTTVTSLDVSLHDHLGNQFTETNQFPTNSSIRDGSNPNIKATVNADSELEVDNDSIHTRNEAFNKSSAIGGEVDDTSTTLATEGNVSPVRITTQRALHSNLRNTSGEEIASTTINSKVRLDVNTPTSGVVGTSVPFHTQITGGKDGSGNLQSNKVDSNGSQYNVLTSAGGTLSALIAPYGNLRVTGEGSTIFFDDFDGDTIDTSNRWVSTTSGGATISQTNSLLTITTGTAASARGALNSIPLFTRPGYGFLTYGVAVQLEASILSNTHRFWGAGTPGTSISITNPVKDGIGFEITTAGVLNAVVYKSDTVVFSQAVTAPTDGELHSYIVETRADKTFWFLDSFDTPVASSTYKNPDTTHLPCRLAMINGSTPPVSSPTFSVMALGIADSSGTTQKISDSLFPWRTANIDLNGNLRVSPSIDSDAFGASVVMPRVSQIVAQFDLTLAQNDVTTAVSGGGTVTQSAGLGILQTTTAATASAKVYSNKINRYAPGRGIYSSFTAAFTPPTSANSHQRAGYYDTSNGIFIGYQGTSFGITVRGAGVDTFTPRTEFNGDLLLGDPTASRFTRNGLAEAIDLTTLNIFRIDWAFLGAAPIKMQVLNPDGAWVTFHTIRRPNLSASLTVEVPSLPITMEVIKSSSDATNLILQTASWDAGTVEDSKSFGIEDVKSRKYVTSQISGQTTSQTVYTVSSGRTLRVTTMVISVSNSSLAAQGAFYIRDGGSGGTIRVPLTTPPSSNQSNAGNNLNLTFSVPLRFTSDVYAHISSGTLTYSVMFVGYEAEI